MSLGLSIAGTYPARGLLKRCPAPAAWLDELSGWVQRRFGAQLTQEPRLVADAADGPTLCLNFHPCTEDIQITAPERGRIRLSAMTTSVGPGYHQFLCDVMDAMAADLGVAWAPQSDPGEDGSYDETGYYYRRDRAALEASMLEWLGGLCTVFVKPGGILDRQSPDDGPRLIAMPLGILYEYDAEVLTPMGPRDRAWLIAGAADPRSATDFFAWWDEGETARTLLGRALALMWSEVRWCEPACEEAHSIQVGVAELLSAAYERDPSLEYPWREWAELMRLVDWEGKPRAEVEARAARTDPSAPLIGYRRRDVRLMLPGGWSISVPGGFSTDYLPENGQFVAYDRERTVRFTSYQVEGGPRMEELAAEPLPSINADQETPLENWTLGRLGVNGYITRAEEDGHEMWMLASRIVTDGGMGILTIYFDDDDERDWAVRTWRSVRYAGAER